MGVRGLQTYVEKYCAEAFELVDIQEIAEQYREDTGNEPVIVIDAASCLRHLYCMKNTNWILGGQLKEFAALIQKLIRVFMSIGVQLVFFFDGMPVERKHEVWIKRRMTNIHDVFQIFDLLYQGKVRDASNDKLIQLPPCAWHVYKTILTASEHCKCYTSIREADEEIAEYAVLNNCFAIMGQDSDYMILEGPRYYLSVAHLDLDMLQTRNYNRRALAEKLEIHTSQLPLFATLAGNDIVSADDLISFHRFVSHWNRGKIPYHHLFPSVAKYVKKQPVGKEVVRNLPQISVDVFRNQSRVDKLKTSLWSYWIDGDVIDAPKPTGCREWDHILTVAQERQIRCIAPPHIYTVMNSEPFYLSLVLEDFRNNKILPSGIALLPLRQKLYGILLKEKPNPGGGKVFVKEWIMHGERSLNAPKQTLAIFPDFHPGLLQLWNQDDQSPETVKSRWRCFCEAVSPKLNYEVIMSLQRDLVVPLLALLYLRHETKSEVQPMLERFEIEAFLAQALLVNKLTHEDIMRFEYKKYNCDPRAVHLCTLFQRVCIHLETLVAACGHPVTELEASALNFLDGKVFHTIYLKCKSGSSGSKFCGKQASQIENYQRFIDIIYPSKVKKSKKQKSGA